MKGIILLVTLASVNALGVRLKDIASVRGERDNQLSGYGIVVGLAGTGDKSLDLTSSSLAMVLKGMGVDFKGPKMESKNAASVVVTALLKPFVRAGNKLDVSVSSIGSATSLEGGVLLATALRGVDGKVYAMAQGRLITSKKTERGQGSQATVNAMVPSGGLVERELMLSLSNQTPLRLLLHSPDFTTSARVVRRINEEFGGKYATAPDAGTIEVLFPYGFEGNVVDLIAQIENVEIEADTKAKVVVNSRTGTVVMGENVRILPVAVAHGNLKVQVKDREVQSIAGATSAAAAKDSKAAATVTEIQPVPETQPMPEAKATTAKMGLLKGTTVSEIVTTLNEMGASPEDLIAILQGLKSSGALIAELEMQ
ncbi:MAG: flagellar basal body P-ring protein FlgI [Deltaproteobacteria bacterium]|nr:flagellar basal body P-ring protein FlgI [Deltaproteobacteria bacterium]